MTQASAFSRSASHAIAGYAYQFNLTIVEILQAAPGAVVTVEGYEDVDVLTSASAVSMQCKYLAAAGYTLAGIRSAVLLMLESYAAGRKWDYRLYVYFGDDSESAPTGLTVDELKRCLTEKKKKPTRTVLHYEKFEESVLQDFTNHFTIVEGPSFAEQESQARRALREALGGSDADAAELHYGNALAYVVDLARKPEAEDRKVTRKTFIESVNKRPVLLDRWTRELLGEERLLKGHMRRLKAAGAFSSKLRRGLVLNTSSFDDDPSILYHAVQYVASEGFKPGMLTSAMPWTVLIEGPESSVVRLKAALATEGILFHDGYESYAFNSNVFDRPPVLNTTRGSRSIADTSYNVRIVSAETYAKHAQDLKALTFLASFGEFSPSYYVPAGSVHSLHAPFIGAREIMSFIKGAVGQ